jgi:hypothetical protein
MRRPVKVGTTAGLALVLIAMVGCKANPGREMANFNDEIAASNKKIAKASFDFRASFVPLASNQPVDEAVCKNAYNNVLDVIKKVREDWKKLEVPPSGGDEAKALHKAYDEFLDGQQKIVEDQFAAIPKLTENKTMAMKLKWDTIQSLITKIQEREQNDRRKLEEAQGKVASSYNLKLVPER